MRLFSFADVFLSYFFIDFLGVDSESLTRAVLRDVGFLFHVAPVFICSLRRSKYR